MTYDGSYDAHWLLWRMMVVMTYDGGYDVGQHNVLQLNNNLVKRLPVRQNPDEQFFI